MSTVETQVPKALDLAKLGFRQVAAVAAYQQRVARLLAGIY
jgi:hypothetical protein